MIKAAIYAEVATSLVTNAQAMAVYQAAAMQEAARHGYSIPTEPQVDAGTSPNTSLLVWEASPVPTGA